MYLYCEECGKLIHMAEYYDNDGICDECFEDELWYYYIGG